MLKTSWGRTLLYCLASFIIGAILFNNCRGRVDTKIVEKKTTEYFLDTIIIRDTLPPKIITKSVVEVVESLYYDTTAHNSKYYNQEFKDENYVLNTFGGYVDSIQMQLINDKTIIRDSVVHTIERTETIYSRKNELWAIGGVDYRMSDKSIIPNVGVQYQLRSIGLQLNAGYDINMKSPIVGGGIMFKLK